MPEVKHTKKDFGNPHFFTPHKIQGLTGNNFFFESEGVYIVFFEHVPANGQQLTLSYNMDSLVYHLTG